MKIKVFLSLLILYLGSYLPSCTSFSCYSNQTWYGMNFDYPDTEMRFRLVSENDTLHVFEMGFIMNGGFYSIYGYNSLGEFSNLQMLYPEATNFPAIGENELSTVDAWYYFLHYFDSVASFTDYLEFGGTAGNGIMVRQMAPTTLHSMMSDPTGNAMVLEAIDDENYMTYGEDNILVMTNFPNFLFAGLPYTSVMGVGADRFIAAYENILTNFTDFDYNDAWQTLENSFQNTGGFQTLCSTIFDPASNELFIVLQRDLYRVWRVRIDEQIMETYSGFSNYSSFALDANGVSSYQMMALVEADAALCSATSKALSVYPNPFNPSTTISFNLRDLESSDLELMVYNMKGQKIKTVPIKPSAGQTIYSITWNGTDSSNQAVSSGIYFAALKSRNTTLASHKMILMK